MAPAVVCARTVILAALALAAARAAKPEWIVARSPHFEMYATAGEGRARAVLRHFETVHAFFSALLGGEDRARPIRIVALSSKKEFELFRPNDVAVAYFHPGYDVDWIVMSDCSEESYPVAIHEYVHVLMRQPNFHVPVWLNEGMAEVYSTLRPHGAKVLVGALIPGRMHELQTGKWTPIEDVLRAGHDSPLYNEKAHAGMFYGESWLLTHMMLMEEDWRRKFPAFLQDLTGGADSVSAIQKHFGRTPKSLDQELRGYTRSQSFRAALIDHKLEKSRENVTLRPAADFEWRLVAAELMKDRDAAARLLDGLRRDYPDRPEAVASLAYYEIRKNRFEDGRGLLR